MIKAIKPVRTPYQLAVWGMIPERGPQTAKRELKRERGQTGPRDHGTKPAHQTGPPGHRFWSGGSMIKAIIKVRTPHQLAVWGIMSNQQHYVRQTIPLEGPFEASRVGENREGRRMPTAVGTTPKALEGGRQNEEPNLIDL